MKSVKDTEIKEKYGIDDDNNDNLCHFVFINTMTLNLHLFLFFFSTRENFIRMIVNDKPT